MKVSVIMPVYNREKYIGCAIESVLRQTYADFELLVIDDGSTDHTGEVVAACRDPRVKYFKRQHSGISAAMNHGLRVASGRYIARLDSDDIWLPEMLASQIGILEREPETGVVYAKAQQIDENGNRMTEVRGREPHLPDDSLMSMLFEDFTCNITVVSRRHCLDLAGLFDTSLHGNEDWDMWLRVARHCTFKFNDKILAFFRSHAGNITKSSSPFFNEILESRVRVLDKAFSDPNMSPQLMQCKPLAYGNVYVSIGAQWLSAGRYSKALSVFKNALRSARDNNLILLNISIIVCSFFIKRFLNRFEWGRRFHAWQSYIRGKR